MLFLFRCIFHELLLILREVDTLHQVIDLVEVELVHLLHLLHIPYLVIKPTHDFSRVKLQSVHVKPKGLCKDGLAILLVLVIEILE